MGKGKFRVNQEVVQWWIQGELLNLQLSIGDSSDLPFRPVVRIKEISMFFYGMA